MKPKMKKLTLTKTDLKLAGFRLQHDEFDGYYYSALLGICLHDHGGYYSPYMMWKLDEVLRSLLHLTMDTMSSYDLWYEPVEKIYNTKDLKRSILKFLKWKIRLINKLKKEFKVS